MHKFFVDKKNISNNIALIRDDDVKHIYKVLRLKTGDDIIINNLNREEYLGKISEITKEYVKVILNEKLNKDNEPEVKVHLFQGIPKNSKMDYILQKCTEIGAYEFTPVVTKRVMLSEIKKKDRWQKIALEAAKQSQRTIIPNVNDVLNWESLLTELKKFSMVIVPYEEERFLGIKKLHRGKEYKDIALVIGPEGGFEREEIESLKQIGAKIVTLGHRILRTETAAGIASSFILYELSDMGGSYE
ncbi:MAG: 16S rRNA (uracil(1498)-N(3))-methyltransferase [Oscillospiraceae bacterium]|nr:16S rRNA (uracil(1498)-N(3))-methyltransferase [Oscillospiraceae bacterium]